ncbi:MAG: DUF692 domain-containing protein, partial [Chromatiales bacterium]|nr:DUF692 domain-containing protein [Chromatiales bacterium]
PWPLDQAYLDQLKKLIDRINPVWISDHLCWDGADDVQGQLLPVPYTEEMLDHIVPRIEQIQEFLGRQILLENVPLEKIDPKTEMPEADFVKEVAARSDSMILLDIGSLHTTSVNQNADPLDYIARLPAERVQQIHLTGATILCNATEATDQHTPDPIWQLFLKAIAQFGPTTTMIERLDTIPPLSEMVREIEKARCALDSQFPQWQQS